jgi:hypothetical protein
MAADNTSMQKAERDRLFAQLVALGDFRRWSVSENYRKCGKPNCACAQPDHAGTGRGSCGRGRRAAGRRSVGSARRASWRRCAGRWPGTRSSRRPSSRSSR